MAGLITGSRCVTHPVWAKSRTHSRVELATLRAQHAGSMTLEAAAPPSLLREAPTMSDSGSTYGQDTELSDFWTGTAAFTSLFQGGRPIAELGKQEVFMDVETPAINSMFSYASPWLCGDPEEQREEEVSREASEAEGTSQSPDV